MRSDFSLNNNLWLEKPETLRVRSIVDGMRLGTWLYTKLSLSSALPVFSWRVLCVIVLLFLSFFVLFIRKNLNAAKPREQSEGSGGIRTLAVRTKALHDIKGVTQCYHIGSTV